MDETKLYQKVSIAFGDVAFCFLSVVLNIFTKYLFDLPVFNDVKTWLLVIIQVIFACVISHLSAKAAKMICNLVAQRMTLDLFEVYRLHTQSLITITAAALIVGAITLINKKVVSLITVFQVIFSIVFVAC